MGNGADDRLSGDNHAYVAGACQQCGNFTLVQSDTQLKCDTCGSDQSPTASAPNEPLEIVRDDEPQHFPVLRAEDTFGAH